MSLLRIHKYLAATGTLVFDLTVLILHEDLPAFLDCSHFPTHATTESSLLSPDYERWQWCAQPRSCES